MAKKKIKELSNYDLIRGIHMGRIKQLNDFFIESQLTIDALLLLRDGLLSKGSRGKYSVPKMDGGSRVVERKTSDVLISIDHRVSYSHYAQSLVFAIAKAEDYISSVLLSILLAFPRKILISAKGNESGRSVELKSIIEKGDLESVLFEEARIRLADIMYASPAQYISYFQKIAGFELGNHTQAYIEMKATRDLLVHNEGIINELYISKSGNLARGKIGEPVPVDDAYFEGCVSVLKSMTSTIYRGLIEKYGDSETFSKSARKVF